MLRLKAIFLFCLFSVTTFGNTVAVHFCKGEVTDLALFGEIHCCCEMVQMVNDQEKSCHEKEDDGCHDEKDNRSDLKDFEKGTKNCCDTETVQFSGENQLTITKSIAIPTAILILNYNLYFFQDLRAHSTVEPTYQPPLIPRDIPVLIQSFLI